eukprot:Nitzschia sp. Nitz4//scaffold14_size191712//151335//152279//NITZ4_001748-RA/size191712-processed-gene-0.78-mRNA-1//-1//CDS//3329537002//8475//frame0
MILSTSSLVFYDAKDGNWRAKCVGWTRSSVVERCGVELSDNQSDIVVCPSSATPYGCITTDASLIINTLQLPHKQQRNNMPRFFDDYSNTYLTHDSAAGRKQQRRGWKFRENFKLHYESHVDEWRRGPMGLASAQQAYVRAMGPADPMIPPLPPGWKEEMDDVTHIPFYYNDETGERSWVRPGFLPPPPGPPPPGMGMQRGGPPPPMQQQQQQQQQHGGGFRGGPPPPQPHMQGPPPSMRGGPPPNNYYGGGGGGGGPPPPPMLPHGLPPPPHAQQQQLPPPPFPGNLPPPPPFQQQQQQQQSYPPPPGGGYGR